jgi:hypothetical protein
MKTIRVCSLVTLAFCALDGAGFAQGMLGGSRSDPVAGLAEIFGKDRSFSAVAHTTMKGTGAGDMQMEMSYAVLEGKIRTEADMTKMQGGAMPPQVMAQIKAMGMDKTVTIVLPGQRAGYLVYPGLKAYCDLAMGAGSSASATESNKPPKVDRTEVGKDTIDGHPCVKYKVVVTPEGGMAATTFVWQATDLNNCPLQTEVDAGEVTVTTRFQNIDQSKPAASLFEPPSDFKHFNSPQELMMSSMGAMGGMRSGRGPVAAPPRGAGGAPGE